MNSNNNSQNHQHEPGEWYVDASGQTRSIQEYELPDGRIARVGIRKGQIRDESVEAAEGRQKFWETVHPPELTQNLERQTAALTAELEEITGYDRDGKPQYRLQGSARHIVEMKLASRSAALQHAQRDRAKAERIQAERRAAQLRHAQQVEAEAQAEAQRLIREHEVGRRAAQIAAKAGIQPATSK